MRFGESETDPLRGATRLIWLALLPALTIAFLLVASDRAFAERAFTPRFSENVQGSIATAANSVLSCPDSDSRCPGARAGTGSALNNNQFSMGYIDIDGDPATFNSSSAQLSLPSGSEVLFAGLYYGAKTSAGAGGNQAPDRNARGTVRLRAPGDADYQVLAASVDDSSNVARAYAAFVDVTSIVRTAGTGSYTAANIQAGTGEDRYGGWSLVVAYRNSEEPARNLTIFDGLETVTASNPAATIGVSGFRTPASGPVRTSLGFVSYEGDRGTSGDSASLNSRLLSSATNPPNNFFNSSISNDGSPVTTKVPDYNNQLGFDTVRVNADGYLENGAESAAIRLQTSNDVYLAQVISFSTDLFSPDIEAAKSVENVSDPGGPVKPGDTLRYSVSLTNTGGDGATGLTSVDQIPAGTTYVDESLRVTAGPGSESPVRTDEIGDDAAEYLPGSNAVRFRLGVGANESVGGILTGTDGAASSTTFTFEVLVTPDLVTGTVITNAARADYLAQTLLTPQQSDSNEVVTTVSAPDLAISKSHAEPIVGVDVEFAVGVENLGAVPTDGSKPVTVTDELPPSAFGSLLITSAVGWDCSASSGLNLSCTRSDPLPVGESYPDIEFTATAVPLPPPSFSNTATVIGGGDTNPGNNTAVDFLPIPPTLSDLALTKEVAPGTVNGNGRIEFTLTVTNSGPSDATGVTLVDTLPDGLSEIAVEPSQGVCPSVSTSLVECSLGLVGVGQEATVRISATVELDGVSGVLNEATVEGEQPDPRPENNAAEAVFDVSSTADLSIIKESDPEPEAGAAHGYTITITNSGPSDASGVEVNDQIPPLFTPASVDAADFSCGPLPGAGGILSCAYPGSLAIGEEATIRIEGTLAAASAGVPVTNAATVFASQSDPDQANNSSTVTIYPLPFADISVSKTASRASVKAGQNVEYLIGIRNLGPTDAETVTATDFLPTGTRIVSLPSGCSSSGSLITCELGAMPAGSNRSLSVTLRPGRSLAGQRFTNGLEAYSPQPDPVQANNSDSATVSVTREKTRLRLGQVVDRKATSAGGRVRFTVTVSNPDDASAFNSTLCQKRPRRLRLVRAPRGNPRPGGKVCWSIARIDPGQKKTFTVLSRAVGNRGASGLVATATLTGPDTSALSDEDKVRITAIRKQPKPKSPVG